MEDDKVTGQKPSKKPIVLMLVSGFSMLLGIFIIFLSIGLGDTFGDLAAVNAKKLASEEAEYLLLASFLYILFCLAVIDFWNLRKPWIKKVMLILLGIHVIGFFYLTVKYPFIFDLFSWLICISELWITPLILDIYVGYYLITMKNI